jgi:hypothetical protein
MGRRKPWLRLDADADTHPRVAVYLDGLEGEKSDAAFGAWVRTLLALKRTGEPEFRTEHQLKLALGAGYKWVKRMREAGLVDGLTVRDWSDYQRPDPDAAKRAKSWRERTRTAAFANAERTPANGPDGDRDRDGDITPVAPNHGSETVGAVLARLAAKR